jgi:hypothetical protein
MTLYQLQRIFSFELCESMVAFDELERIKEEVLWIYFSVLSQNLPGGPEKTTKNFLRGSRCLDRDSNRKPPGYKSEAWPLESTWTGDLVWYLVALSQILWTFSRLDCWWLLHASLYFGFYFFHPSVFLSVLLFPYILSHFSVFLPLLQ